MPATPARIGFIKEEFRRVVAETPAIIARHGNMARESEDPIPTYFDNTADAQFVANARQAILDKERRRFRCRVQGLEEVAALNYLGQIPVIQFVDEKRGVDNKALVSEITMDFETNQASVSVWG